MADAAPAEVPAEAPPAEEEAAAPAELSPEDAADAQEALAEEEPAVDAIGDQAAPPIMEVDKDEADELTAGATSGGAPSRCCCCFS